jgi:hypothetical protein
MELGLQKKEGHPKAIHLDRVFARAGQTFRY